MTAATPVADTLSNLAREREAIYTRGHLRCEDGSTLPCWPVGLSRERGEALRDLAITERARRCIETGFALGLSASFLLEAALHAAPADSTSDALVVSMDPYQTLTWKGAGRRHLRDAGITTQHRFLEEPSELALPRLAAAGERFDLAFIDGDHRFEGVLIDTFYARKLVGDDKLIVLDDAWMPAVQKCAAFFESAHLCRREPTPPDSPLSKLILLRVERRGDSRSWDHFVDF
jgi:predicted O-methyltransferase YrrM